MKVLVTGGAGFFASHIVDELEARGHVVTAPDHHEFDLLDLPPSELSRYTPDVIVHAAAAVGGIGANVAEPGRFFHDNLMMGVNLMDLARRWDVQKMVTIGTACMYPASAWIPMVEADLWEGHPARDTAPYAFAKRAILEMGQAYRQEYGFNAVMVIPTNLYGPRDHFDLETGHVIPALIRRFSEASDEVVLWGTGLPTRDFLYVTDAARGIVDVVENYDSPAPVNLGSGVETSIRDLAEMIADLTDYRGGIEWDTSKPDGTSRRLLSIERAEKTLGWKPQVPLVVGLEETIDWYRRNV